MREARRFQKLGYVDISGEVPESWDVKIKRTASRSDELGLDIPTYETRVQQTLGLRVKFWLLVTQQGVDLVYRHLPDPASNAGG
jgi:hypothetical protein